MRILQIHNKYLEKGGEDTVVANERQLLESYGNVVALCAFDNKDLEGLSKIKLLFKTLFNRASFRKVEEHIAAFKPDIIHIHNVYYEASSAIFWAIKRSKVPAVMTIHNYRLGCVQGLLFRDNAICKLCLEKNSSYYGLKYRCFKDSFIKSMQLTLVNKFNQWTIRYLNPVNQYIFLAEFTKNLLSPILNLRNSQGVLKNNYVDDFGFTSENEREDVYLFVGRLNEQKGVKVLIEAFKKNKKRLNIIGSGPLDNYVNEALQTHSNIYQLGYANSTVIIEKLKKCKALIVPSLTYEGQPMTILEAFSTGTPVLATNTKNLDTLIQSGINGFLFDASNSDAIIKSISDFESHVSIVPDHQNSENKNQNSESIYSNARKSYEKDFSPTRNYQQLMSIYKKSISIQVI